MTTARSAARGARAASAAVPAPGHDLVVARPLVLRGLDVTLPLQPGDQPRIGAGATVVAGAPIADRLRDARLVEIPAAAATSRPGDRWTGEVVAGAARRRETHPEGELLFESNGKWRIAAGEHRDPFESPIDGIARDVRAGIGVVIRVAGAAIPGAFALGDPTRGRLEIATDRDGELLPRSLDVRSSGAILVVGARIDAEALTRARAMGIRGVVVATLPGKDRRDYLASEARQRAALHRLPPFGVLVLHGSARRAIGEAVMGLLEGLAGRDVAIVGRPAALVFDPGGVSLDPPPRGTVHVRSGPHAGRAGQWAGAAGLRRFPGGTHLEAGFVRFGADPPIALPLGDLERLV